MRSAGNGSSGAHQSPVKGLTASPHLVLVRLSQCVLSSKERTQGRPSSSEHRFTPVFLVVAKVVPPFQKVGSPLGKHFQFLL